MKSIKLPSWIEGLLGVAPVPAPPHVFAVDGTAVRYGSFHSSGQGWVFESLREVELPADCFTPGPLGGPLRAPKVLWQALGELISGLEGVKNASLVLPDAWLRLTFVESQELPKKPQAREEVLRWKLKRLVPFRVEDLRLAATSVVPFPSQEEPLRFLVGFAIESLVSQLEDAFHGLGIDIGRITNYTLAILAGLEHNLAEDELAALVTVQPEAFTLGYLRGGESLLYRYKAFGEEGMERLSPAVVHRELRLTTNFVRQSFPEAPLRRCFLAAPPALERQWLEWLGEELDIHPEPLGFEHFPLSRSHVDDNWLRTAPLIGAASQQVSW